MSDSTYTQHEQEAHEMGVQAAKAAASWVLDGNASQEHYARLLKMLDEGDPEVFDFLPYEPNLSGEYSDDPTPTSLYEDITGHSHADAEAEAGLAYETLVGSVIDALADAYEAGISETFQSECERLLRAAVA